MTKHADHKTEDHQHIKPDKKNLLHSYLIILLLILLIIASTFSVMTPLWGDYLQKLGGNLQSAGVAVAILSIGISIFIVIFSILTDRFPYYRLYMIASSIILVVCWFLYMAVSTVYQLYGVLILFSISRGMLWPAYDVLYAGSLPKHGAAKGWGLYATCEAAGGGIGALIGSHVVHFMSYKTLFLVMVVISVIALGLSVFLPRIEKKPPNVPPHLSQ